MTKYEIREVTMFQVVRITIEENSGGVGVIGLAYDRSSAERMRVAMMEFDTYHPEESLS